MRPTAVQADGAEIAALLRPIIGASHEQRFILGICGPPGAGKSTLAEAIAARVPGAVAVPMDGFHLADVELRRRGLMHRKGAPETFDAWGYAALLARIRDRPTHTVLAPAFDRQREEPAAGALPVAPDAGLIVTEGNYLLLDRPEWQAVREQLDAVWHVTVDADLRRTRLRARHERFGKSANEASAWVARVDDPNAEVVAAAAQRADAVLDLTEWDGRAIG